MEAIHWELVIVGLAVMLVIGFSAIFIGQWLREINQTFKEFIKEIRGK